MEDDTMSTETLTDLDKVEAELKAELKAQVLKDFTVIPIGENRRATLEHDQGFMFRDVVHENISYTCFAPPGSELAKKLEAYLPSKDGKSFLINFINWEARETTKPGWLTLVSDESGTSKLDTTKTVVKTPRKHRANTEVQFTHEGE